MFLSKYFWHMCEIKWVWSKAKWKRGIFNFYMSIRDIYIQVVIKWKLKWGEMAEGRLGWVSLRTGKNLLDFIFFLNTLIHSIVGKSQPYQEIFNDFIFHIGEKNVILFVYHSFRKRYYIYRKKSKSSKQISRRNFSVNEKF